MMRGADRERRVKRLIRPIVVSLAWVSLTLTGAAPQTGSSQLDRIRLLPPVLLKGEKGYSLEERMRHYKVEAVSVAVIRDFRVLWTEARGFADREAKEPATPQTLFQAGSISKPVAAAGVLREVEQGKLLLDRDVNEYLKSWKLPETELTAKQKVTLERILSHSAGLTVHGFPGYAAGEPVPTLPQVLDGVPPANTEPVRVELEPGSKGQYSGGGYTIAQLVMTETLGKPFPELMRELVLAPVGMTHSTYEQPLPAEKLRLAAAGYRRDGSLLPGRRHTYPEMAAAGLWTTSEDLARFAIAIARARRGDPGSFLSKEMALRMTTPFSGDVGLGFFLQKRGGETTFGHNGADEGFQALLIMHREKGYGAAVLANSDNGIALADEIVAGLSREYKWASDQPALEVVKVAPGDLALLAGRYQTHGDEAFSLTAQGDRLIGKPLSGEEYELYPISHDLFVRRDRSTRYRIERSGNEVTGILLTTGSESVPARRMAPGGRLPSDALAEGKIDEAINLYRKLFAEKPDDQGIAEPRLNVLGYQLATRGEFAKAIAILRLNSELRPKSSNAHDSLAEIYLASGDRARALETYRKVLEMLPTDTATEANLKARLLRNAQRKVEELSR
jgi:CubicO group peptidase (beta-lactamase class C family)